MTRREILSTIFASTVASGIPTKGSSGQQSASLVSIIRVLANPEAFDQRRVRVAGYLEHNGVDRAVGLYVSELDGRNGVISNSIDLHKKSSSTLRQFMGKYVVMNATFHRPVGPLSEFLNGHFDDISGIKALPRPE
jgi:hypothetical protein